MAPKLEPDQQKQLSAFVNTLGDLAGYSNTAQWARDSGYSYPNLTNLRNGKSAVSGLNLLRLLQAAAERTQLPLEQLAVLTARLEAAVDDPNKEVLRRLDELGARLDEVQGLASEGLTRLGEGGSHVDARLSDEAPRDS